MLGNYSNMFEMLVIMFLFFWPLVSQWVFDSMALLFLVGPRSVTEWFKGAQRFRIAFATSTNIYIAIANITIPTSLCRQRLRRHLSIYRLVLLLLSHRCVRVIHLVQSETMRRWIVTHANLTCRIDSR